MSIVRFVRNDAPHSKERGSDSSKPKIVITMGDAAGVGPEILIKSLKQVKKICNPLVIGDERFLKSTAKRLKVKFKNFTMIDLKNIKERINIGKVNKSAGKASAEYIRLAVKLALRKKVDAMVTLPINKANFHKAGIKFAGHTEMIAKLTNTKNFAMMLTGNFLRVVLVTIHVSLKDVPRLISRKNVYEKIQLTYSWLKKYFKIKDPVIAVAGLNPHCGEAGLFGREEITKIIPAVKKAKKNISKNVIGPVPPDVLFYKAKKEKYDAIICMYHDQGAIPLKMIAFERGVNVTLGLPIIRTSPDHGTAYDIAGRGTADTKSFIEAVKLASFLAK